jgi:5,10-methylenetetrahydromethanopterin reductase
MGMMELAGEIADGVVLNYCVPPAYNSEALEHIAIGAQRAGRRPQDIDRPQLIVCSVDYDHRRAVQAAKELITQYLAQQPHIAQASGTPPETVLKVQSTLGWPATREQIHEAMQYVPDELIENITASGTPEEVRAKVEEYKRYGCTCPILYPLGDDVRLMIDTFAQA